jgi:hypothetical protein
MFNPGISSGAVLQQQGHFGVAPPMAPPGRAPSPYHRSPSPGIHMGVNYPITQQMVFVDQQQQQQFIHQQQVKKNEILIFT